MFVFFSFNFSGLLIIQIKRLKESVFDVVRLLKNKSFSPDEKKPLVFAQTQDCGGVDASVRWFWDVNVAVSQLSSKVKTPATLVA